MNDVNKKPEKNADITFAIRVYEEEADRYDREGREGWIW